MYRKEDIPIIPIQPRVPPMPNKNFNGQTLDDCLIISFDKDPFGKNDTILLVSRKVDNDIYILNRFRNKRAEEIYRLLLDCKE